MSARQTAYDRKYRDCSTTVDVTVVISLTVGGSPEDAEAAAEREVLAAIARGEDVALHAKVVGSVVTNVEVSP